MIERFLRKLFRRCLHEWKDTEMTPADEIVSSRHYIMQRCEKCKQDRYRKR